MTSLILKSLACLFLLGSLSVSAEPRDKAVPQRIASGTVASDEILIELLKERGELPRLIAVSELADDPRYSNITSLPKGIKGRVGSELESLIALRPDLVVLASYNRIELKTQLARAGIVTLEQKNFESLGDVKANIQLIGHATGLTAEANKLAAAMDRELAEIAERATKRPGAPLKVLSFAEDGVLMGKKTLFDAIVRRAGARNLAAEQNVTGWTKVSTEVLAGLDPDLIVIARDDGDRRDMAAWQRHLASLAGWRHQSAVKEGRLALIPAKELLAASQHVVKAVAALASSLDQAAHKKAPARSQPTRRAKKPIKH